MYGSLETDNPSPDGVEMELQTFKRTVEQPEPGTTKYEEAMKVLKLVRVSYIHPEPGLRNSVPAIKIHLH